MMKQDKMLTCRNTSNASPSTKQDGSQASVFPECLELDVNASFQSISTLQDVELQLVQQASCHVAAPRRGNHNEDERPATTSTMIPQNTDQTESRNLSCGEYILVFAIFSLFISTAVYIAVRFSLHEEKIIDGTPCRYLPPCHDGILEFTPNCATDAYNEISSVLFLTIESSSSVTTSCTASNLAIWRLSLERSDQEKVDALIQYQPKDTERNILISQFALYTMFFSLGIYSSGNEVETQSNLAHHNEKGNTFCLFDGVICTSHGSILVIDLEEKGLHGTIPTEIGLLHDLKVLKLAKNEITGTIPTEISQVTDLHILSLHNNYLTGTLPSPLSTRMTHFDISYNLLGGNLHNLITMPSLEILDLASNGITGMIPPNLSLSPFLYIIDLSENYLNDSIDYNSFPSKHLQYLSMGGNAKLDFDQFYFGQFRSLVNLDLRGGINVNFEWSIALHSLRQMTVLELSNVELQTTIPSTICVNLAELQELSLSNSSVEGTLPKDLGHCSRLKILDLSSNNLVGTVPSEFGCLTRLQTLRLANNNLHGEIPNALCYLQSNHSLSNMELDLKSKCPPP